MATVKVIFSVIPVFLLDLKSRYQQIKLIRILMYCTFLPSLCDCPQWPMLATQATKIIFLLATIKLTKFVNVNRLKHFQEASSPLFRSSLSHQDLISLYLITQKTLDRWSFKCFNALSHKSLFMLKIHLVHCSLVVHWAKYNSTTCCG